MTNSTTDAPNKPGLRIRLLQGAFWITLGIAVAAEGAVDIVTVSIVSCLLTAILVLGTGYSEIARASVLVSGIATLGLAALVGWTWMQSQRGLDGVPEHPAWQLLHDQIKGVKGALSIAPEQSWTSIVYFCPILAFLVCLTLFRRQREAIQFLR